jgi:hypothetical protein
MMYRIIVFFCFFAFLCFDLLLFVLFFFVFLLFCSLLFVCLLFCFPELPRPTVKLGYDKSGIEQNVDTKQLSRIQLE